MRLLILLFSVFWLPLSALAQTPVSKETANAYFGNCVKQQDSQFSPNAQKMFCACTAARMTQFFSMEDMKAMTGQNEAARFALNKMIINIYAPCMEEPTREYHYKACMTNPNTARLVGDPDSLCRCSSHAIAQYVQNHGPRLFQELLLREPAMEDPMQALYNDPKFQTFAQSKLMGCLK